MLLLGCFAGVFAGVLLAVSSCERRRKSLSTSRPEGNIIINTSSCVIVANNDDNDNIHNTNNDVIIADNIGISITMILITMARSLSTSPPERNMFALLRSRWRICFAWRYFRARRALNTLAWNNEIGPRFWFVGL